jgi:hypothetical protein
LAFTIDLALAYGDRSVLPVSSVIELTAVTAFALNLGVTFLRPPAHLLQ